MKPLYFDYNSTAPLAKSVKAFLAKGVFFEANASSVHYLGKQALKLVNQTTQTIKDLYDLNEHDVVYTSGATEGLNWCVKSFALNHKDKPFVFICFSTDHSVALNQADYIHAMGGSFEIARVLESGTPDLEHLQELLSKYQDAAILINWTWVNNETGVIWDLKIIEKLKNQQNMQVHVDAPQSIFKIKDFDKISSKLDMYSFSGHKIGSMLGVGFSFIHKEMKLRPLLNGGDQQYKRSGTLNTLGIYSIHLAIQELKASFDPIKQKTAIEFLRKELAQKFILMGSTNLNLNTISLALKNTQSQLSLIKFDLEKIAVSSGSACNSGNLKPSHVINAMGFSDLADKTLRFSFEFDLTLEKAKEYLKLIEPILDELEA